VWPGRCHDPPGRLRGSAQAARHQNAERGAGYARAESLSARGRPSRRCGPLAPAIRSANHAAFRPGKRASFTVRAAGLPVPSVTEAGKLPTGLRFTAGPRGTAVIAGTPAASAKGKAYAITLTARDGVGHAATQRFTLRVG
jgi:hypothetical protein